MLYIINAFSGNVNVLSVNILFSHRIIIETEMIRAVAGLGVLKHYAVTVIRLAADDIVTPVERRASPVSSCAPLALRRILLPFQPTSPCVRNGVI